jgi:ubiquinone/menaquinone biosynthesis C-methylase UbiE
MNDLKNFWTHPLSPQSYHKIVNSVPSGVIDEKLIENYINKYLSKRKKWIVNLGIGTGRELVWLDKVLGVEKIIGFDYSAAMLSFLRKNLNNYKHKIELVKDDLLKPVLLPKIVKNQKQPMIYLSLINTFGNFTRKKRIVALKNIASLLKSSDRIILALYTRHHYAKSLNFAKDSLHLQTKNPKEQTLLSEIIEYTYYPFLWIPAFEKYHQLPRLWYDKKKNDLIMHLDGKVLLYTHRFSQKEIKEEFKTAGLKIDELIEGKAMWIVVGKNLNI